MDNVSAQQRILKVLHSQSEDRLDQIKTNGTQFVHYTSADVAFKIIQSGEIWMRNAIAMNDFSEIQHGETCLRMAWESDAGKDMRDLLNDLYPGLVNEIVEVHDRTFNAVRTNTFLTCVSEHEQAEDITGRLSMWRAYGSNNGIAIVVDQQTLMSAEDDLKAYSSPVEYYSPSQAGNHLADVVKKLHLEKETLKTCGYKFVLDAVLRAFRFAVVSTKHPGFAEEREWRIIHMPDIDQSSLITKEYETVGGVPQIVYKLSVRDLSRIARIIIGPTKFPKTIADAFIDLLSQKGVGGAFTKVVWSNLPLRQ